MERLLQEGAGAVLQGDFFSDEEDIDALIDRALEEDPACAGQIDIFSPTSMPQVEPYPASDAETLVLGDHLRPEVDDDLALPERYNETQESAKEASASVSPPSKKVKYFDVKELPQNPKYNEVPCEFEDSEGGAVRGHVIVSKDRDDKFDLGSSHVWI